MRTAMLWILTLLLAGLPAPAAALQEIEADDLLEALQPGTEIEARLQAIRLFGVIDDETAAMALVEALEDTLKYVEKLEKERSANEKKIRGTLVPQMKKGRTPNYAGLERFELRQRELGEQITREERAVRGLRDAMARMRNPRSIRHLLRVKSSRPARLVPTLVDAFRDIDDPQVTERLIELLTHKVADVRLAAADSLSHHDPAQVPSEAYGSMLESEDWNDRAVAMEALARLGGPIALQLLVERTPFEEGRQLTILCELLEQMTGQKLGRTPRAWLAWWEENHAGFEPERVLLRRTIHVKESKGTGYWGIEVDSLRVIFVIDTSGTMQAALEDHENMAPDPGRSRLDLARKEVKSAISGLPPDARFNLVAYNDVVMAWSGELQTATPGVKQRAYEWLDDLIPVGKTNIFDALETAFALSPWVTKGKGYDETSDTIFFLSDGGPTAGRTTDPEQILAQVQEWNRIRKITIHTVGIGRQLARKFMQDLARQNGGICRIVEK